MKPSILLKIASVIAFLYFAGHTAGIPWTPGLGPAELTVIEGMKSNHFDAMGSSRTYWDFYFGFGIAISIFQLLQAVLLWQLSSFAKTDPDRMRPILASLLAAYIATTVVGWMYFFIAPLAMAFAITVLLALALFAAGKRAQ